MKPDVLKMRSFDFPPPKGGGCDLLVIAGEHSGDEQAARMVAGALAEKPGLRVCAFGGEKLASCGAQPLFDMTSFSVVGLVEVLKNYGFFKKLSEAVAGWISEYRPKAVCFVDYPGFNLHIASLLKERGVSRKGGGSVRLIYYISPQIWAWKASRRFKMASLLDSLAVIFPFETECYADTDLDVHFVGHPFLSDSYEPPVKYGADGEILMLSGSREIAVSRIFPVMCGAMERLAGERAAAVYPTPRIKKILEGELSRRPALSGAGAAGPQRRRPHNRKGRDDELGDDVARLLSRRHTGRNRLQGQSVHVSGRQGRRKNRIFEHSEHSAGQARVEGVHTVRRLRGAACAVYGRLPAPRRARGVCRIRRKAEIPAARAAVAVGVPVAGPAGWRMRRGFADFDKPSRLKRAARVPDFLRFPRVNFPIRPRLAVKKIPPLPEAQWRNAFQAGTGGCAARRIAL